FWPVGAMSLWYVKTSCAADHETVYKARSRTKGLRPVIGMMPLTAGRPEQCGLSKALMFPRRFGSINSHMHYHTHPHTRCAGWSWHDFYHFQCGSRMNDLFHMTSRTRELGQEKIRAGGHKWGARGFCRWPQKPVALGRRAEQLIARR